MQARWNRPMMHRLHTILMSWTNALENTHRKTDPSSGE